MKKLTLLLSAMLLACATNLWAAEPVTVSKTVDELVTELNWTVSADQKVKCYKSFNLDENITVSTSGTPNCGSVWGTKNRDWRLYQAQKGDVTITAAEGYSINSITLTYGNAKNGSLLNGIAACSSDTEITVNDNNITLTVGNSTDATNGQIRITQFSVTYVAASSAAKLKSLAIAGEPTKKEYIVDESFDVTGLTVTATYSDGNTADVTGTVDWWIDPETFTTTGDNLSVDVRAYIGEIESDVVTINNIKVRNLYNYAITWKVNGEDYTTGNPTTTVVEGNKITVLPATPADNTLSCSTLFVGWSTNNLGSAAGQAQPDDLFTTIGNAPVVTENTTYHAVFATAEGEVKEYFNETFDGTNGNGGNDDQWSGSIKFSDLITDNNDWDFVSDAGANKCAKIGTSKAQGSATTPVLTGLTGSAVLTFRAGAWKGDATKLNLSISVGKLSEESVTLADASFSTYTINITDATAESKITFKGAQKKDARFFLDDVVVKSAVTLKDFRTNCEGVSTAIESAAVETPAVKTIENGQLIILRDGVKYNAMGVRLQ